MNVELSPETIDDLTATLELIAQRDTRAAEKIAANVWATLGRLATQPIDGIKTLVRWRGRRIVVRSWPVHPFRIYYRRTPDTLFVLRAFHHSRRPIARP